MSKTEAEDDDRNYPQAFELGYPVSQLTVTNEDGWTVFRGRTNDHTMRMDGFHAIRDITHER